MLLRGEITAGPLRWSAGETIRLRSAASGSLLILVRRAHQPPLGRSGTDGRRTRRSRSPTPARAARLSPPPPQALAAVPPPAPPRSGIRSARVHLGKGAGRIGESPAPGAPPP